VGGWLGALADQKQQEKNVKRQLDRENQQGK
jgi:hypothetical protein